MPTIADVRKKYPQYDDLSDEQLADGFHKKFYRDIPREDFLAKLGVITPARVGPEEVNELPEPPTSKASDAVARGIEQGASLGFSDEIGAAKEAGTKGMGVPEVSGPFSLIAQPIVGAVRSLLTDDGAKDYEAAIEPRRAEIEVAETEHPGAFMAGNVAGALATAPITPAAKVAQGAGWAGRALAGAKTGAGYGAAYGVGTGETAEERLGQGATGALAGGLTGMVASPVVDGVIAGGRALKNAVSPIVGAFNPEKEAARRVVGALEADSGPGAAERAAAVLDGAQDSGTPLIVADAGGEMTRGLARSAANTSPEARDALQGVTRERFDNQADRFSGFVQDITGATGDTAALAERVQTIARHTNRKAYSETFRQSEGVGIWDDDLETLAQASSVQEAIKNASRTSSDRVAVNRMPPPDNPFIVKDGVTRLRDGKSLPNLQFWDLVKRNLDDEIGKAQRTGEKSRAADVMALKHALVEKMDGLFPAYKKARAGASAFFDAEDALEAGQKMVGSPMENAELRRGFSLLPPVEQELAKHGYVNEMMRRASAMGDSRNVAGANFLKSPQARERMDIVLGKPGARRLEAFVEVENLMNVTKRAVDGNSTTARQLIEAGLAGGALPAAGGGIGYMKDGYGTAAAGALIGMGMRRGYNLVDAKVAMRVGQMLASQDPQVVRKAVNMISRNPRLLKALRAGQEYIGRIASPVSGNAPVPAMISGRAEDEQ
jgi:hypothetical protein